jgi:thymidylate synthase
MATDFRRHNGYVFLNVKESFEYLYYDILKYGWYMNGVREFRNVSFSLENSRDIDFPYWRKFNLDYAKQEYDWYLSGDRSIEEISKRAKLWKKMADDEGNVNSNYGYHWLKNNQLEKIECLLMENMFTRRAVVLHYDYNQLDFYDKDTPCNLVLHFQWEPDNRLSMTIFARSIDLVYGYCNDIYCFSRLLQDVCNRLHFFPGTIHYFISNLHIYEKHFRLKETNI